MTEGSHNKNGVVHSSGNSCRSRFLLSRPYSKSGMCQGAHTFRWLMQLEQCRGWSSIICTKSEKQISTAKSTYHFCIGLNFDEVVGLVVGVAEGFRRHPQITAACATPAPTGQLGLRGK
eukprot:565425-Amphidinium_carterae.1